MKNPPLTTRLKTWWTAKDCQDKIVFLNKAVIWCTVINLSVLGVTLFNIYYHVGACK